MIIMGLALVITVLTGLDYIREAVRLRRRALKPSDDPWRPRCSVALLRRCETLATAESLTGGLVGDSLTSVPGSSASYLGGVISYATRLKATLAGVDQDTLAEAGPVAERDGRADGGGHRPHLRWPTGAWPPRAWPDRILRTAIRSERCTWPSPIWRPAAR